MLPYSEISTKSATQGDLNAQDELWDDEDTGSDESFEDDHRYRNPKNEYVSTNLLSGRNLTLADVIVERVTLSMIKSRFNVLAPSCRFKVNPYGQVDPRAEYKQHQGNEKVDTMVLYHDIHDLCQQAEKVMKDFLSSHQNVSNRQSLGASSSLQLLQNRIIHDHMRGTQKNLLLSSGRHASEWEKPIYEGRVKKRNEKEIRKAKLNEAHYLLTQGQVPILQVSKRLKLSTSLVRSLSRERYSYIGDSIERKIHRPRFHKFHPRAREVIRHLLETSQRPLQLRDFQNELMSTCRLKVSRPWLGKFLRSELAATYRRVKPIQAIQNYAHAKLQRQFAAAEFIQALGNGLNIINIDESVIRYTDQRLRGWVPKSSKNQVTSTHRIQGVNMIAALSSQGEFMYTINIGKTNSHTFGFFLCKLCAHLDAQDSQWRKRTVIMMDNANYHRGVPVREQMVALRMPVLYMGPYQFRMAPVEMVFNYVKNHDLNPLRTRLTSRDQMIFYTKELGIHISRMELVWGRSTFMHCLTAALEDLSLVDL